MSFGGIVGLPWEPVPGREGIEVKSNVAFAKESDVRNMATTQRRLTSRKRSEQFILPELISVVTK